MVATREVSTVTVKSYRDYADERTHVTSVLGLGARRKITYYF